MPSYRYLRDIKPEDTDKEQPPQYTKKQKVANWWHYHWKWTAVGLAVLLLVAFFARDIFLAEKPDITIGILAPTSLPEELTTRIQEGFATYVQDTNGDGKVIVRVQVFTVQSFESGSDMAEDPYTQMAGVTQLNGAYAAGEPVLFLAAPQQAAYYQQVYSIFGNLDGTLAEEGQDVASTTVLWRDCTALQKWDLQVELFDGQILDGQVLLADFHIGLHAFSPQQLEKNKEWQANWDRASALLKAIQA